MSRAAVFMTAWSRSSWYCALWSTGQQAVTIVYPWNDKAVKYCFCGFRWHSSDRTLYAAKLVETTTDKLVDMRTEWQVCVENNSQVAHRTGWYYAGPTVWKSLPDELSYSDSFDSFKRFLKTIFSLVAISLQYIFLSICHCSLCFVFYCVFMFRYLACMPATRPT